MKSKQEVPAPYPDGLNWACWGFSYSVLMFFMAASGAHSPAATIYFFVGFWIFPIVAIVVSDRSATVKLLAFVVYTWIGFALASPAIMLGITIVAAGIAWIFLRRTYRSR